MVGLRRCIEAEAFEEIVHAVHATGVGLGGIAHALVALVSGTSEPFPHRQEAAGRQGCWATAIPCLRTPRRCRRSQSCG